MICSGHSVWQCFGGSLPVIKALVVLCFACNYSGRKVVDLELCCAYQSEGYGGKSLAKFTRGESAGSLMERAN